MRYSDPKIWVHTALLLLGACAAADGAVPPTTRYELTASGRVDAHSEARYLAAERDARISKVLVRPGDVVAANAALLVLGCDDVAAEALAARSAADAAAAEARLVSIGPRPEARAEGHARAAAATARLSDARDLLARAEALHATGFVSIRRLAELRSDVAIAAAQKAESEAAAAALDNGARVDERRASAASSAGAAAQADALESKLEKCTLRTPIAGTVLKVLRREGEFSGASAGTPLIVVGDMQDMIVRAEVTDREASLARIGQRADIWVDGGASRWHGRVVETSSLMGRRTARSLDPSDRFDRDIREVLVAFDRAQDGTPPPQLVGLRVTVGLRS